MPHLSPAISSLVPALEWKRIALERSSDFWTLALEIATIAVVVGVAIEVIATILEVRDETRRGEKVRLHNILTLVGAAVVVLAVAGEFWAELEAADVETNLRATNALEQSELQAKSARAITDISLALAAVDGLDKYIKDQKTRVDRDMKALELQEKVLQDAMKGLKSRAAALQSDMTKKQKDLQTALQSANSLVDTLSKRTRPRRMLSCDSWEPLRKISQMPIEILYFNNVADAQALSAEISLCLDGIGWRPPAERPIPIKHPNDIEDDIELAGGSFSGNGITVALNPKGRETSHFPAGSTEAAVTKALSDVFGDAVTTNLWGGVPEGTIRIVNGPKG